MRASFLTIRPSPSSAIESFTFPRRLDSVMRTSQTPLLAPPVAPLVLSPRHENETPSPLRDELRRENDHRADYPKHDPPYQNEFHLVRTASEHAMSANSSASSARSSRPSW